MDSVTVWLWQAGNASGVAGDCRQARRTAARFMRSGGAGAAVVEQAYLVSGTWSLAAGYAKVSGRRWVACRHPGGRVSWRLRACESQAAAGTAAAAST